MMAGPTITNSPNANKKKSNGVIGLHRLMFFVILFFLTTLIYIYFWFNNVNDDVNDDVNTDNNVNSVNDNDLDI